MMQVQLPSGAIGLVALHPPAPDSPAARIVRDRYLRDLGGEIAQLRGPVIAAGDFNATPWSYPFQDFAAATRLHAGAIHPSWPSLFGAFGIPIDHVLASENVGIERSWVGPDLGSDHLPIMVQLRLP
jgi:endonuclease/exonuclease/phosphatase (EEP) superfamily protein YafD